VSPLLVADRSAIVPLVARNSFTSAGYWKRKPVSHVGVDAKLRVGDQAEQPSVSTGRLATDH
jgi:hypothetical protein